MHHRIPYYAKLFFLNPYVFFQKIYVRILLKVMPCPKGVVPTNIGGYTIKVVPSRSSIEKSIFFGYYQAEIANNIKRYLTTGGVFIDVGAGIGYFSAIASDIVGVSGEVHCFEPLSSGATAIKEMIVSNPNSNIVLNDCALSVDNGFHNYYMRRGNNNTAFSMIHDVFLLKKSNVIRGVDQVIKIRTQRLDTYLEQKNINEVSLMKIDVEGYEFYVLKGLADFFERATHKPPIICEIYTPAYKKKSDFSLQEFWYYMNDYGYQAYNIFNSRIKFDIRLLNEITDVIFRSEK